MLGITLKRLRQPVEKVSRFERPAQGRWSGCLEIHGFRGSIRDAGVGYLMVNATSSRMPSTLRFQASEKRS
jgi:hypothetical protein